MIQVNYRWNELWLMRVAAPRRLYSFGGKTKESNFRDKNKFLWKITIFIQPRPVTDMYFYCQRGVLLSLTCLANQIWARYLSQSQRSRLLSARCSIVTDVFSQSDSSCVSAFCQRGVLLSLTCSANQIRGFFRMKFLPPFSFEKTWLKYSDWMHTWVTIEHLTDKRRILYLRA